MIEFLTVHMQSAACSANRHGANENCANYEDDQRDQTQSTAAPAALGSQLASSTGENMLRSSVDKQCAPPDFDEVEAAAETLRVQHVATESSDTEADDTAEPAGAGPRGVGSPMMVGRGAKARPWTDGAGLCSPGRWDPHRRPVQKSSRLLRIRSALRRAVLGLNKDGRWIDGLFQRLCGGEVQECPFPEEVVVGLRDYAISVFSDSTVSARARSDDLEQPIKVRLLQALLHEAGDPDHRGMQYFCSGVRVGVGCKLPRTPAVFSRKRRWRLEGQSDRNAWENPSVSTVWQDNYRSAREQGAEIERLLRESHEKGWALQLSHAEARARFPRLVVSSLGAGVKQDQTTGETLSVRMVLDGTHRVALNNNIRVRDQDRCPTAADVRRQQREQAAYRRGAGIAADVQSAHRLPAVAPEDWHLQGCRASPDGPIYVFKVGVFGISSIAYWWSRLGGAAMRVVHHVMDIQDELWLLLMADDFKLESTSQNPSFPIVGALLLLTVLGVPLSWRKIQGGERLEWIGYEVWVRELALGITSSRAAWASAWCAQIARDGIVSTAEFATGVGRLSFVCGVLEYERPFLAPCYAHLANLRSNDPSGRGRNANKKVPLYVACALEFIGDRITARKRYPSDSRHVSTEFCPRVDARAEGREIMLGGWLPMKSKTGTIEKCNSPWFALKLDEGTAPWAFSRNGEPYRTIAALEAMATLVAIVAFAPWIPRLAETHVTITSLTDNQGNSHALTHLSSTRFPLCVVAMELAAQMDRMRVRLDVHWTPRNLNQEADDLSNGKIEDFSTANRVMGDICEIEWLVLDKLMKFGMSFEKERTETRDGQHKRRRLRP